MVICEKHKFVFLRVPKNASSSLAELFVNRFCEPTDKWTEVNDCGIMSNNVPYDVVSKYRHHYRFIHLTLQELVDNNLISEEEVFHKQIITVLRDPFMRQLSLYFFLRRGKSKSVDEFRHLFREGKHETDTSNCILQTEYPKLNGQDRATWWLYNNLDNHVSNFCKEHGITGKIELKKFKGGYTPKQIELFDKYYDQKTTDAVRKYYEKDFEKFIELRTGLELS